MPKCLIKIQAGEIHVTALKEKEFVLEVADFECRSKLMIVLTYTGLKHVISYCSSMKQYLNSVKGKERGI
jgi:hypothetical protein